MNTQELRECTPERLADLEKNLRRQIFDARMKNHTNQLDDTASLRRLRRDLARIKTIMTEKALAEAPLDDAPPATVSEDADTDASSEENDDE
ncbi:MAG: 50S ribosomal protein L29 [Myxococcota bacterium]